MDGDTGAPQNVRDRNPVTSVVIPAIMADVEEVKVVVAHNERATLRVGDVFLKIDADQTRTDVTGFRSRTFCGAPVSPSM
jgi:hypothetical protein